MRYALSFSLSLFFFIFFFPFSSIFSTKASGAEHNVFSSSCFPIFCLHQQGQGWLLRDTNEQSPIDLSFLPFHSIDVQWKLEIQHHTFLYNFPLYIVFISEASLFYSVQPYILFFALRQGSPVSLPRLGIYYGARWLQAASFYPFALPIGGTEVEFVVVVAKSDPLQWTPHSAISSRSVPSSGAKSRRMNVHRFLTG